MSILLRLLTLYRPYTGWLLLGILLASITVLSNIALMAVSGWFIASMAIAGAAGVSMNYFSPAAMIRASAIFRTVSRYTERLVTHEATFRLLAVLRVWSYRHLEPLVPAALEDIRSGDLVSRIGGDIDTLDNYYVRIIVPFSVAVIGSGLATWVMSLYHDQLAVILITGLAFAGVALPLLIARLGRRPGAAEVEQTALLRTQIIDGLQGMAETTAYGALEDMAKQLIVTDHQRQKEQAQLARTSGLAQSGVLLITSLTLWFVVFESVSLVTHRLIAPAELAMLALFTLAAFEAVMPLPDAFRVLGQVQHAAARVFAIIDKAPVVCDPESTAPEPANFDIQLQQVSKRYRDEGAEVLKKISLDIPQGRNLAIVGTTGSGKSSLIQLLLHDRDANEGQITIGDRPVSEYSREQLHQWISVVPQHTHLFNTSIRNNLLLAKPDATQEELESACRQAHIHSFIEHQPDGYDTWVGETGVQLSGGQARRIAIARALLRDFRLLILDEPGEGLDASTEKAVIDELVNSSGNRGLLMISHSHAGLELMDEIIVLDGGRCVEKGNYRQLMSSQGHLAASAMLADI